MQRDSSTTESETLGEPGWLGPALRVSLAAACLAVFASVPWDADPGFWDASRHAMDGVFYLDMVTSGSVLHPVDYAQQYYERYPAIAPVLYPPVFSISEAFAFALLGVHPWVARLVVLAFLTLGAFGMLRLGEDLAGSPAGGVAGLLYLCLPLTLRWSRDVMLEPAALSMMVWSLVFLRRYSLGDRTRDLALCLGCAILAPYTKQTAVILFPMLLATALGSGQGARLLERRVLFGVLAAALCGVPLAYVTLRWGTLNLEQASGALSFRDLSWLEHATYHLRMLPETAGWPLLAAMVVAPLWAWRAGQRLERLDVALLLSWIVLGYLWVAGIALKEPRQGFLWVAVLAVAAGVGLARALARVREPVVVWGVALAAVATLFGVTLARAPAAWTRGLAPVAAHLSEHWEGTAVVTSLDHEGALIFRMRSLDAERRFRVYRSSKIFESSVVRRGPGVPRVDTALDLVSTLRRYGVRYLVVEPELRKPSEVDQLLRGVLAGPEFQAHAEFTVHYPSGPARIVVYRYLGAIQEPGERPRIFLPIVDMELGGGTDD